MPDGTRPDRTKALKAIGAAPLSDRTEGQQELTNAKAHAASRRMWRAKKIADEGAGPCPRRTLLDAALAGDSDAIDRCVSLYGALWRDQSDR